MARELAFDKADEPERSDNEPAFLVDVDGFEGPLDLLWSWLAAKRLISRGFPFWRSPSNISNSSRRPGVCG